MPTVLTAAEWERKKKREAELQWKKILAYYMMQTYVTKAQAQAEEEMRRAFNNTSQSIKRHGLLSQLLDRLERDPQVRTLLEDIGKDEPQDSPLGSLLHEMKEKNPSREKLEQAMTRVIEEEPPRMLRDAQKEQARRREWKRSHSKQIEAADGFELVDEDRLRYEQLLEKKKAFFRALMPPELYKELERQLDSGAYTISEEQLVTQVEQPSRKRDYNTYVAEKAVEPKEKEGKLANSGDIYSAAAYMLAAWEQKDKPEFDEAKADARAMELSASRAFKAYMEGHPGSLLSAARGVAVEETYNSVAALDADLSRRDAILVDARDSLKKLATGEKQGFYELLKPLDRFVNADTEPTKKEKNELERSLATFITTYCNENGSAKNKGYLLHAMRAVKVLLPEREFQKVVDHVNIGRKQPVQVSDFDVTGPVRQKVQSLAAEGPKLSLHNP